MTRLASFLATLAEIAVAIMMLHIVIDVFVRSVFKLQFEGTLETVSNWYMVATVFLPFALVQLSGQHLRAEIFTERFGPGTQRWIRMLGALATLLFAAAIVWYAAGDAYAATLREDRVELTRGFLYIWPTRWLVVVGFGLTGLIAAMELARALRKRPT